MNIDLLIKNCSPIAHWTTDLYGDDNVYEEFNDKTLVNDNATLGAAGNPNGNFADNSINLNGGHLSVLDGTFLNDQIATRDFIIMFHFKMPNRTMDNPITGFKPIVSKWEPEAQFMIGMDGGNIKLIVQTSAGVVEVEHPIDQIVYNNRWNTCIAVFNNDDIALYLNNYYSTTVTSSPIITSTNSLFTLGGTNADVWLEDFFISDVCVLDITDTKDDMVQALYILPRNTIDIWKDWNPTHLYDFGRTKDLTGPIENLGSESNPAYLISQPNINNPPYKSIASNQHNEPVVIMPHTSWITIDDNALVLDHNNGWTFIMKGGYDRPYSNNNARNDMRILEYGSLVDTNNDKYLLGANSYSSSTQYGFHSYYSYDGSGVLQNSGTAYNTFGFSLHYWEEYGAKRAQFNSGGIALNLTSHLDGAWSPSKTDDNNINIHAQSAPATWNRFWYSKNSQVSQTEISIMGVFDYLTGNRLERSINYARYKLVWRSMYDVIGGNYEWVAHGFTTTNPQLREEEWVSHGPYYKTSGHTFATLINDPLGNRQNEWNGASYLGTTSNYTGGYTSQDDIGFTANATINNWIWNRNSTTRYRFMWNTSNIDVEAWMNSRNGVFSYGDVEFTWEKDDPDQFIWTTNQKVIDDGFHMITWVRDGYELQLWIDAKLAATHITSSIKYPDTSNTTWRMYGGPLYFNDWAILNNKSMTPDQIEYTFFGSPNRISGNTTLDGIGHPSSLLISDIQNGDIVADYVSGDDGKFNITLPKTMNGNAINIIALAQDDNSTNNIVVHGPYSLNALSLDYVADPFDRSIDEMILDMHPYAYYKMDETTGTNVADSSGNARDGTIVGGILLDAPSINSSLKAFDFEGANGYIDLPDGYDDFSTGFTWVGYIKYDAFNDYSRLFDITTAPNGINGVTIDNSGTTSTLRLTVNGGSLLSTAGNAVAGHWMHFAARIAPDDTWSLWVNGINVSELSGAGAIITILRTDVYIGRSSYSGNGYFDGKMSNVATFNYAVSDEDIMKWAFVGFGHPMITMNSLIMSSEPDIYFPFDRADTFIDKANGVITLVENGSFDVERNALIINKSVIANNWLTTPDYRLSGAVNHWTIEVLFKSATTHTDAIIVSEWDGVTNTGTYKMQVDSTDEVKFYVGSELSFVESTTLVTDGEWHYIVATYDGTDLRLYVDNAMEDQITTTISYELHDLAIGNSSDGSITHHMEDEAAIDDLAIYPYSFSDQEVSNHYDAFVKKKVYQ